ncbi:MAG TPA: class I SAM-dependent methyltransferase [Caulobacteraceae bacterium]|jgi:SAM-dependent methyltransferase|nr:class I SAM-dependent methyltransferase [Caulobacteraceae bacterium]
MADRYFDDAYLAGLYDAFNPRAQRNDYDFYLPRIMAASAVLDAGCGSGTLLGEAREAGHEGRLCGLDPAAGMLERARRRQGIEWVSADLTRARWEGEFDLVVMTGHAFQAIVTDEDLAASVETVRRALVAGGEFAFETRNPTAKAWERWRPEYARTVAGPDGELVRISTRIDIPYDGRTITFTHTFTGDHPALPQASQSTLRFLDAEAVAHLLTRAGFQIEAQCGDFDGRAMGADTAEIITIARTG